MDNCSSLLGDISNHFFGLERWQSGWMHWSWKPARVQALPGFESLSLRHLKTRPLAGIFISSNKLYKKIRPPISGCELGEWWPESLRCTRLNYFFFFDPNTLAALPIGMDLGFLSSGISRCKEISKRPSFRSAPTTLIWSSSLNALLKLRVAMPRWR